MKMKCGGGMTSSRWPENKKYFWMESWEKTFLLSDDSPQHWTAAAAVVCVALEKKEKDIFGSLCVSSGNIGFDAPFSTTFSL